MAVLASLARGTLDQRISRLSQDVTRIRLPSIKEVELTEFRYVNGRDTLLFAKNELESQAAALFPKTPLSSNTQGAFIFGAKPQRDRAALLRRKTVTSLAAGQQLGCPEPQARTKWSPSELFMPSIGEMSLGRRTRSAV